MVVNLFWSWCLGFCAFVVWVHTHAQTCTAGSDGTHTALCGLWNRISLHFSLTLDPVKTALWNKLLTVCVCIGPCVYFMYVIACDHRTLFKMFVFCENAHHSSCCRSYKFELKSWSGDTHRQVWYLISYRLHSRDISSSRKTSCRASQEWEHQHLSASPWRDCVCVCERLLCNSQRYFIYIFHAF